MNEKIIRDEIALWRSEGLISGDLAETLLSRYGASPSKISWGAVLAGAFGALMIGLGVVALFAANWDELGRPARAAVAISPLAVCGVVAVWAALRNVRSIRPVFLSLRWPFNALRSAGLYYPSLPPCG